jgi:hypothetical protein
MRWAEAWQGKGGVDRGVIGAAAEEAQQAVWLAVRAFCVPILGEEEFNRRIRMAPTGPDEFEMMAAVDPVYLASEAAKCALWCASDPTNAEFASRNNQRLLGYRTTSELHSCSPRCNRPPRANPNPERAEDRHTDARFPTKWQPVLFPSKPRLGPVVGPTLARFALQGRPYRIYRGQPIQELL